MGLDVGLIGCNNVGKAITFRIIIKSIDKR